jgi:aromatic-amino-acid transaminase
VVAAVLESAELRALWEQELGQMRERIRRMRQALVEKIQSRANGADFGFVVRQRGMFSYSGLSREQVVALREKYSVYAIETGRICVAALNNANIDYAANAISEVIR